jgi:tetratricopeptide (TPR) repeat protein
VSDWPPLVDEPYTRGNTAFEAGDFVTAADAYAEAIVHLEPKDDDLAPDVYENLGLALWKLGRYEAAARAFLRALDGNPLARQQSLAILISCFFRSGRNLDGERTLAIYEAKWGEHPEAWRRT